LYKLIEFTNEQGYVGLFLSLPEIVYKGDGNYRPERKNETVSWLLGTHKCAGFLKQKNMIVLLGDAPVARGIAFKNDIGDFGSIGFFECLDDPQAAMLLADGATAFFKGHGVGKAYAPMNGSIWSNYRLMTKGFEDRPFLGEPYNKPYYGDLLKKCGFTVARTWETQYVKRVKARGATASKYLGLEKSQRSKGVKVRSMKDFDEDIRIIYKLAMNSFSGFFLFHELGEQDFVDIFADLKLFCDKRTIKIAYDSENRPIGFGIALPDYRGKLGFIFRYARRYAFLYLGTLQENGESVYPQCGKAIIVSILRSLFLRRKGYISAMMGEHSKARGFEKGQHVKHEYALYELGVD